MFVIGENCVIVLTFGQSEDDTSDEEKQKEIDKRKDEEAKNKAKAESKFPSGASSKGTNTPSGRPKHTDPLKKGKRDLDPRVFLLRKQVGTNHLGRSIRRSILHNQAPIRQFLDLVLCLLLLHRNLA
jgi:hypothetical protein